MWPPSLLFLDHHHHHHHQKQQSHHNESKTINYWAVVKRQKYACQRKDDWRRKEEEREGQDCANFSDNHNSTQQNSPFWLISVLPFRASQYKAPAHTQCPLFQGENWVAICGHFIIHWCHWAHYYLLLVLSVCVCRSLSMLSFLLFGCWILLDSTRIYRPSGRHTESDSSTQCLTGTERETVI